VADFGGTSLLLGRFAQWTHLVLEAMAIIVIAAGAIASLISSCSSAPATTAMSDRRTVANDAAAAVTV